MATITINVPDGVKNRVFAAFALRRGYQETVIGPDQVTMIPNPEGKQAFCKRILKEVLMADVRNQEANTAAETARAAALAAVDSEVVLD